MRCVKELGLELNSACRLILGSAEETGCGDIALYMEKNEMPEYVFSPDADYPLINIEKGRTVCYFEKKWQKEDVVPRIVSIEGGTTVNIVPNRATAVIKGMKAAAVAFNADLLRRNTGVEVETAELDDGVQITCIGKAAHAAHADQGLNAQTALVSLLYSLPLKGEGYRAISALHGLIPHGDVYGRELNISQYDDATGRLTLNFGCLHLDETGLEGNFDSRTPICADDDDIEGKIRRAFAEKGIPVTSLSVVKSHFTPEDSPLVKTLLGIYKDFTGYNGVCLAVGGSTYVHEIEGGVAFGCVFPGKETNLHGANECIELEDLIISGKMFAKAIADICM